MGVHTFVRPAYRRPDLFLLPLVFLAAAQGQPDVASPACDQARADEGIQPEINRCAHADFLAADADLNAQWKRTAAQMRRLDDEFAPYHDERPGYFDSFLASQRAWLAYRDAHCVNEGYWARGGSMEPMLVSGCLAALTNQRSEQLRQLAEYPE